MSLINSFERVRKLHFLIKREATGSRHELAKKMEISRTSLYETIKFMKEWLGAPIEFDPLRRTYYYRYKGFYLDFCYDKNNYEQLIINYKRLIVELKDTVINLDIDD